MGEKQYVIKLDEGLRIKEIPVSKEIYDAYYRPEWREHKREQRDRKRILSYEKFQEMGFPIENHTLSFALNLGCSDDKLENKEIKEILWNAIHTLSYDERHLVTEIYFKEKSERQFAEENGLLHTTVHYRKKQILAKLKKEIDKFF